MKAFKNIQNAFNNQSEKVKDRVKKTANLAKSIVQDPNKFVDKLKYGNYDNFPFSFREMLNKIGDQQITSLEIIRNPLSNTLMSILDGLSGFAIKQKIKETPYDKLFHLKLRINGRYDLEKEANIKLHNKVNVKDQEYLLISEILEITIRDFVENAVKLMGIKLFTHYDGKNNNCQVFVLNLLHANNIKNATYDNFIKQDTTFVFEHNPNPLFKRIMDTATDLGERVNQLTEGQGINLNKIKRKGTLTNFDLMDMAKQLGISLVMCCMKDEINLNNLKNGNYIMNLQNHDQGGSHWCAFIKKGKTIYYFDPFGEPCPEHEYELFKQQHDTFHYNKTQIQDIKSKYCGWFSIGFLLAMKKENGSLLNRINKYVGMFNLKNLKQNDKIVKQYLFSEMV
jgi:hypothetical protein